ncbi:MAG: NnrS family protein [Pseudomonadota bacterium]
MTSLFRILTGDGFRIFFLAGALFALFSMIAWATWLGVHAAGGMVIRTPFAAAPHHWHAHEMIFGYAGAVLGGFFLTAVPSWTGAPAARRGYLSLAAAVWLAGRLAVLWSNALDPWLVAAVDLAFLPFLAAKIAAQLARRPKPQNLMLAGLLALVWSGNLLVHLDWTGVIRDGVAPGLRTGLLGVAAIIAVIGGRIVPAFTRNAMARSGRETGLPLSRRPLDIAGIASAILLPVAILADAPEPLVGLLALAAGLAQTARLAGWRSGWTVGQPLLWSLHLGFAMLGAGYLALAASAFGAFSEVAALHILGIGAVGGMTLAVMSRAMLGHLGRPLVAPRGMAAAYAAIAAAALLRAAGSLGGIAGYHGAVLGSAALWIAGFAIFLWLYGPLFLAPRGPHPA